MEKQIHLTPIIKEVYKFFEERKYTNFYWDIALLNLDPKYNRYDLFDALTELIEYGYIGSGVFGNKPAYFWVRPLEKKSLKVKFNFNATSSN